MLHRSFTTGRSNGHSWCARDRARARVGGNWVAATPKPSLANITRTPVGVYIKHTQPNTHTRAHSDVSHCKQIRNVCGERGVYENWLSQPLDVRVAGWPSGPQDIRPQWK